MSVEREQPSPLHAMVETLSHLATNRKLLAGIGPALTAHPQGWRELTEDLEMMLRERVIIGLRSSWVRRVAVPVLAAYRTLGGPRWKFDDKPAAKKAIEILGQCVDEHVKTTCVAWIKSTYGVEA